MKKILLTPLNILLIACSALIFFLLIFNWTAKRKNQLMLEKIFYIYFIFVTNQLTLGQFVRLNPSFVGSLEFNLSSVYSLLNIAIYALVALFVNISSREFWRNALFMFVANPFLGVIIFIACLSPSWSISEELTLRQSIVFFFFCGIASHIASRYDWSQITSVMRWSHTILLVWSTYYALAKPSIGVAPKGWQGILNHPNTLAQTTSMCVVLWTIYAVSNPKYRVLSGLTAFGAFIVLQRSGGIGGLVTCQVLLFQFALVLFLKRFPFKIAFTVILVYMMLAIGGGIFFTTNYEHIMVDVLNKDLTLTGRTEFWPIIIDKINERPFLGYGLGGFWLPDLGLDNPAREVRMANGFVPHSAHSGFLEMAVACGWVGLAFFIFALIMNIIQGIAYASLSSRPEAAIPLVYMTLMILCNITDSYSIGISLHWFYFVLISVKLNLDILKGVKN